MVATVGQEIVIDAPVDVVWRTVTEPEQVARWFADEVNLQATPGHDGSLTFAGHTTEPDTARSRIVRVSVQSVEPARSLSYRWQHPQGAPARVGNSLLVTFTLIPEGAGTRLRVVETGLEDMGWTRQEQDTYIAEHTHGWVTHLGKLRDHLAEQRANNRS
jgi:uncharacterized protein YndB with AHSA1/START domain